jgi:glycosyltransferase involved in cell wall biosynthesis
MPKKYSVVIPTYNNCEKYFKPCVESVIKYSDMSDVELIVVANGCNDGTEAHLNDLLTRRIDVKIVWANQPLGFAKAVNKGLLEATTDHIVLLNNDTVLLEQPKNTWLERLNAGGISAVLTQHSRITNQQFGVFFCVMIQKKVFDKIGKLDEQFSVGGCEDIDFCRRALDAGFNLADVGHQGDFPIYHRAEGTVHDETLVKDWRKTFTENEVKLAKKYGNTDWYRWYLSNNYERAVFLKGDAVFPREKQRYEWAARNLKGGQVLEIGCSTGYGYQFLPADVTYMGLDYDPQIVAVAKEQQWSDNATFYHADINTFELGRYNTIIAFEVVEHLDNGLEIVEKLKSHCKRLLITVPHNEPKGFWGEHHKLHGLTEKDFPGFKFEYVDFHGNITEQLKAVSPENPANLMLCVYDNE